MADRKITELTALAAGSQATGDLLAIVDVSETASSNKNKKITVESLFKGIPGNVGIGTASPGTKLDVNGAAKANYAIASGGLAAYASSTGGLYSYFASTAGHINAVTDNSGTAGTLIFATGSERLRVDSSGNVGIGTSSPSTKLQFGTSEDAISWASGNGIVEAPNNLYLRSVGGTGDVLLQTSGGNVGIGTSSPGRKLDVNGIIRSDGTSGGLAFGGNSSTPSEGAAIHRPANNTLAFATNSSERMRIDTSGDVMIGTTSNTAHADADNLIVGSTGGTHQGITINSSTSSQIRFADSGNNTAGYIIYSHSANNLQFATNGSERVRIDSAGSIGIGTSSPSRQFHNANRICLTTGDAPQYRLNGGAGDSNDNDRAIFGLATATNHFFSGAVAGDTFLRTTSGGNLVFGTGIDERARINSSGAFMVGQTNGSAGTPGVVCNANGTLTVCTSNSTTSIFNHNSGSGNRNMILFRTDGTNRGSITSNGSTTSYNTTSDHRLKENVVDLDGAITRVKQLQPKRFNFIADADTTVDGFLAHEAQTVVPEAVTGAHNEIDDDGNAVMQGIDQSKLVPLLTAALQEAIAEIETLKTKVAALEAG